MTVAQLVNKLPFVEYEGKLDFFERSVQDNVLVLRHVMIVDETRLAKSFL
jgi:hypothetical protein